MSQIKEEAKQIAEGLPKEATSDDLIYETYVKNRCYSLQPRFEKEPRPWEVG